MKRAAQKNNSCTARGNVPAALARMRRAGTHLKNGCATSPIQGRKSALRLQHHPARRRFLAGNVNQPQ
ncbi:hypothetical protein BLL52_3975 [Rhodoferax antarcticus ANT.BR]|uniref:Uncharacterized protein n=1 Tax=Rhodoferax antarcticus ANT.BR TaxID=1111071 RepID=A0A1Q8YAS6_9BURK|nr:hypothetical protein BLL52_3975 [Rhodoferax antarcticus ANT.BR]